MSWWVEPGVLDKGDIQKVQGRGASRTGLGTSPVATITLVPWEREQDITEKFSVMGTPSFKPFLKSYWLTPVQITSQLSWSMQIMTSSRQYKCGAHDNYVIIWYWTLISWTSSDHGDYCDVSFPLSGNRGYDSNRRRSLIKLSRDITEKFSIMGTIFNPAVREATGSLYKLHTSEIEHTSFPPIAALIGRARSWLVELSQWASKPQVYYICISGQW